MTIMSAPSQTGDCQTHPAFTLVAEDSYVAIPPAPAIPATADLRRLAPRFSGPATLAEHFIDTPKQADDFFSTAVLWQYDLTNTGGYSHEKGRGRICFTLTLRGEKMPRYNVFLSGAALESLAGRFPTDTKLKDALAMAKVFCPARDWEKPAQPVKAWARRLVWG